jgi:hypothetical protein
LPFAAVSVQFVPIWTGFAIVTIFGAAALTDPVLVSTACHVVAAGALEVVLGAAALADTFSVWTQFPV